MADDSRVFVVVLTGGPGAGKSSSLALLRERLTIRGFQVLTVPENATHFFANSEGFQLAWVGTQTQVLVQRMLLDYQVHQEDSFKMFAKLHPTKKRSVILLDSCTLNGKAYLANDEQWKTLLSLPGKTSYSERELLQRYDMIVHLVTSAYEEGCEKWWHNNPGRWHDPEAAKIADEACMNIFKAHPQRCVVPSCRTFDEKVSKVFELINDALHVHLGGRRCRKRVMLKPHVNIQQHIDILSNATTSIITTTYAEEDDGFSSALRRRAKVPVELWLSRFNLFIGIGGASSSNADADRFGDQSLRPGFLKQASNVMFEHRKGHLDGDIRRHVITEDTYYMQVVAARKNAKVATKYVLGFETESDYYQLAFSIGGLGLILDFGVQSPIPNWLTVSDDFADEDLSTQREAKDPEEETSTQEQVEHSIDSNTKLRAEDEAISKHRSRASSDAPSMPSSMPIAVSSDEEQHVSLEQASSSKQISPRRRSRSRSQNRCTIRMI